MNNKSPNSFGHDCGSCVHSAVSNITGKGRIRVALAGNPNTGKSTIFNALTGLKQHTGNWPGKTVQSATGTAYYKETRFQFVDLPGTYSLLSNSEDEQVARDYLLFENPDVTVVVADASRLERHLNLLLQIMQIIRDMSSTHFHRFRDSRTALLHKNPPFLCKRSFLVTILENDQ